MYRTLFTLAAAILGNGWAERRSESLVAAVFESAADSVSDSKLAAAFDALAEASHFSISLDTRQEAADAFGQARNFFEQAGRADLAQLAAAAEEEVLSDLENSRLEAVLYRLMD